MQSPETAPQKLFALVDLNARAVAVLTALLLPDMTSRGHGAVVNFASTAAHAPASYNAANAASMVLHPSGQGGDATHGSTDGGRQPAIGENLDEPPPAPGQRPPEKFADTVMKALHSNAPSAI
ncbi:hypothetical protein ACFYZ5_46925 [Streptomyces chartreusis]|uniref:hypothetical protein n=1 Tax=Streptomyces chartreusis TaxID=1969 RepID=UPI0036C45DAA